MSIPNNFGEGELHNASIEYTKFDADNTQMSAAERLRICEMFRGLTLYGFSIVLGIWAIQVFFWNIFFLMFSSRGGKVSTVWSTL